MLVSLLDRPGGRGLLAKATTHYARRRTGDDRIAVKYDGAWIDVVDGICIPRSPKYRYYGFDLERMGHFARERLDSSLDYWTYIYKPSPGDVIIDVGAGIGIDAITLSRAVGPSGKIHSIEAHPWTYTALEKNCELNGLHNVVAHHCAISDSEGELWIETLDNDEASSVSKTKSASHCIKVPALDFDRLVKRAGIDRIDFLKMNIEGAEELAIKGMSRTISGIKHIAIACHDFCERHGGTKSLVRDFLLKNGFEVFERPDDPRPFVRDHLHGRRA